jgi:hypothetical protein
MSNPIVKKFGPFIVLFLIAIRKSGGTDDVCMETRATRRSGDTAAAATESQVRWPQYYFSVLLYQSYFLVFPMSFLYLFLLFLFLFCYFVFTFHSFLK